jgi:hypothetical protein
LRAGRIERVLWDDTKIAIYSTSLSMDGQKKCRGQRLVNQ